jgi:hypothetical protein
LHRYRSFRDVYATMFPTRLLSFVGMIAAMWRQPIQPTQLR